MVERYDPYAGYERYLRRTIDVDALKAADVTSWSTRCGRGAGWIRGSSAGGRIRVTEIHQERNPFFGGVNPEPIRPNVDEALDMIAGGATPWGCSSMVTRIVPAPPTSRARSSTSSR